MHPLGVAHRRCAFQTHENLEHLAMMEVVFGPIHSEVVKRADRHGQKFFKVDRRLNWPEGAQSRESIRAVSKMIDPWRASCARVLAA